MLLPTVGITFLGFALMTLASLSSPIGPAGPLLGIDGQEAEPAFRTDAQTYELRTTGIGYEVAIPFVFTNPKQDAVYIVNCRGFTHLQLEKRVDGDWVTAWVPVTPSCLSPPIVVEPGERYSDTVRVSAGRPGSNVAPQFEVADIPGEYRLVWMDVLDSFNDGRFPFGPRLPLESRVSNRFEIRIEDR